MTKILIVTVGGSPGPILTAIATLQPDRVIFLCSDGPKGSKSQVVDPGKPCKVFKDGKLVEELPNIPAQAGLSNFQADQDLKVIQNPDDLMECYQVAAKAIAELQQHHPNSQIQADYTGGTKTMSVGLLTAALDYGIPPYLTTSTTRQNLRRVEWGEATERVPIALLQVDRNLQQLLPRLLQQYNYPAAIAELDHLLQSIELPAKTKQHIRQLRDCCGGFNAWDRFDHRGAWRFLENYMGQAEIRPLVLFLKRVISSRAAIDPEFEATGGTKGHGYEVVEDLLLNAERRATQERYDDAVGRLYRALELLAQIRLLQEYGIATGNVDLQKIPEPLRQQYQTCDREGKIQLPLLKSYGLLSELAADSLGELYRQRANALQNALQIRNYSLFAHGFKPITKSDYEQFSQVVAGFTQAGIAAIASAKKPSPPPQFLTQLNLSHSQQSSS